MQVFFWATVKIPCMISVQMFGIVVFDMLTNCPKVMCSESTDSDLDDSFDFVFLFPA